MTATAQDAPCTIVLDPDGVSAYEIPDGEGRVWRYLIDPVPGDPFAFVVRHVGGKERYCVRKPPGRLWECTCADAKYRAKREARSCKHVCCCRALLNNLDHLRPLESLPMSKADPDEAAPPSGRDAEAARVAALLAAPFEPTEVKFKPATVSGNRALALPYVDARVIQDRLDDVLGVMNWQDSYECLSDGPVVCRLKIRLGDEWIVKEDVGGQSEQPDEGDRRKAAFSDALKRAAVKFGIGRYLYRQKPQWVDYDPQKRQFTQAPRLPVAAGAKQPAPQKAPSQEKPAETTGIAFHRRLQEYDSKLTEQGVCSPGDLVKHVAAAGKKAGFAADMTTWAETEIKLAREETRAFEAAKRQEARTGVCA